MFQKKIFSVILYCIISTILIRGHNIAKRSYSDQSVHGYTTERTCWWNEMCKEEFQRLFRCRCPQHYYCRSPGRYYDAFCSMTNTGYIWTQPKFDWTSGSEDIKNMVKS